MFERTQSVDMTYITEQAYLKQALFLVGFREIHSLPTGKRRVEVTRLGL